MGFNSGFKGLNHPLLPTSGQSAFLSECLCHIHISICKQGNPIEVLRGFFSLQSNIGMPPEDTRRSLFFYVLYN